MGSCCGAHQSAPLCEKESQKSEKQTETGDSTRHQPNRSCLTEALSHVFQS